MALFAKKRKLNYGIYGFIFVLPFFVVFLIFQLYPILYSIILSFTDYQGFMDVKDATFTFSQYTSLIVNPRFLQSIVNTFIIWMINFVPQVVVSFLFAALFTSVNLKMKGAGVFKIVYYLPNIVTAASVAVLFKNLFNYPDGIIDKLFKTMGIFSDPTYNIVRDAWGTRILISFIQFWRYFGYTLLILAAAMMGINPTYYEAATIDGASKIKSFFFITLPLLRPIVLYTLITSLVGGLQMFEIPYLICDGGPMMAGGRWATETISVYIYHMAFEGGYTNDYALASAASVYLFLIVLVFSFITFKFFGDQAFGMEKKEKQSKKSKEKEDV